MRLNAEGWVALTALVSTGAILGHNLWLIASRKTGDGAEGLRLEINTSDLFPGSESAIAIDRIADFSLYGAGVSMRPVGYRVEGDSLTAEVERSPAGTLLAALTLHPRVIRLEPEKFHHYLVEEEAHHVIADRDGLGQSGFDGREVYTKYAKAMLQAGERQDETFGRTVGQRLEIIPAVNPCLLRAGDRLSVQVLFEGAPVMGLRASVGCDRLNSGSYIAHVRTDDAGCAEFDVTEAGRWYVRTHLIRRHENAGAADWESHWSSLTFEIGGELLGYGREMTEQAK
ncbi:MAG: DUF4198 domain-containing protein [Acidobacteria bacterium]|nr:DUF4198 domain-containing protein [Acidobacteriota bacterium]